ncbi:MAG: hypothetical protein ACK415_11335 [Thermodesulfovibrionales bacterium]
MGKSYNRWHTTSGKLLDYGYTLTAFGSVLPDLIEYVIPSRHRGISHSLILWLILSIACWLTSLREAQAVAIGVMIGHLLM